MSKKLFAEFIGTFTLIFIGAGSILNGKADLVGIALAHGLAIGIMVSAFAGISGAHFNPAVSFAMLVTKRISISEFLQFVVAQLAGAAVAAISLGYFFGKSGGLGTPALGGTVSVGQGFIAETIATFLLVITIFGVAVDKRGTFLAVAGLPIGLMISIDILAVGPISGASMNPARWFGPALISGSWNNAWLYLIAPLLGAAIAGAFYEVIAKPER